LEAKEFSVDGGGYLRCQEIKQSTQARKFGRACQSMGEQLLSLRDRRERYPTQHFARAGSQERAEALVRRQRTGADLVIDNDHIVGIGALVTVAANGGRDGGEP
jgi:hypothetical protein